MRHPHRATISATLVATLAALALNVSLAPPGSATAAEPEKQPEPRAGSGAAMARLALDASDETAALQAVHIGLTQVPDGATFVWRRAHGRLSGAVRPVSSFKNAEGDVCRHLVLTLRSGAYTRTVEGAACRSPDGRWTLEG
ncbi:MAG: hypothetical protein KJZ80_00435 [Hyphomicrobiaceae bacterium]|nr:hypothetical protein [Hyphomicrobiaceae bacterium]